MITPTPAIRRARRAASLACHAVRRAGPRRLRIGQQTLEQGILVQPHGIDPALEADARRGIVLRAPDQLAQALHSDERARVAIEGHTDSTGSRDFNIDLSFRRAQSVQTYLISHGISATRISVRGMGPDFPVADNTSQGGRLQNRRVEVIVQNTVALR
jgi:hypothetical protein